MNHIVIIITVVLLLAMQVQSLAQQDPVGTAIRRVDSSVNASFNAAALQLTSMMQQIFVQDSTNSIETLVPSIHHNGGYGTFSTRFSPVAGQLGTSIGGYGGWFFNKSLMIGGGGFSLTSNNQRLLHTATGSRVLQNIDFGYGGGMIEYIAFSDKLLHYGANVLIAGGSVELRQQSASAPSLPLGIPSVPQVASSARSSIFVLEPSIFAEINLSPSVRANLGISYRFVGGFDSSRLNERIRAAFEGLSAADFSGLSVILQVKFGKF
jgi:hypothetical protein